MKFGQFMPHKRKNFIKKFCKNLETSSKSFCVCNEFECTACIGKWNFEETTYNRYLLAKLSKFVHISMLTSSDSFSQRIFWKLKKRSGTSFQATFLIEFVVTWPNFITRLCLLPKLFSKMCFMFHAWAFDDFMTFEYLKS